MSNRGEEERRVEEALGGKLLLVTGGAGFLGASLVREMVRRSSCEVLVLDSLFNGRKERLFSLGERVRFVEGDVADPGVTAPLVEAADLVLHFATHHIMASVQDPAENLRVNAGGTLNLLLQARRYGVQRFLYASTSSIFGNPRQLPLSEESEVRFFNPYAVSKYAAESYCRLYGESQEVPVTIVRYSNVFGENQDPRLPYSGVISRFMLQALRREALTIYGNGEQSRDFTYIGDALEATLLILCQEKTMGRTYNTGSGQETSINRLVSLIKEVAGVPELEVRYVGERAIDNIQRRYIDISRIREEWGWEPQVSLREGLQRTARWLRQQGLVSSGERTKKKNYDE